MNVEIIRGVVHDDQPPLLFREVEGEIRLPLYHSRSLTGHRWFVRLRLKGLSVYDRKAFCSDSFEPVRHDTEVAVIRSSFFHSSDITIRNAWLEAQRRNHSKLQAEAACILFEQLTEEDLAIMGLDWIMFILRKPVKDFNDNTSFLVIHRDSHYHNHGRYLCSCPAYDCTPWDEKGGFAFAA